MTYVGKKISAKPFQKSIEHSFESLLDIIHSDVCGPMPKVSLGGARYFATFIHDKSKRMFVYFLKNV